MKRFYMVLMLTLIINQVSIAQNGKITSQEREFITDFLEVTHNDLIKTITTLNDDKWNYRPTAGGWSVSECMEHIILAEGAVFQQVKKALEGEANNTQDVSNKDAWLIAKIADRGVKVKTPLPPKGTDKTKEEMINQFKSSREMIANFLEDKNLPLRNHFGRSPYGPADAYQLLIVIAAHAMRHNAQMAEVLTEIVN